MLRGYVLCGAMEGNKGAAEGQCLGRRVSLEQRPDWLFTAASHSAMRGKNIPGREHSLANTLRWALNQECCPGVSKGDPTAAALVSKRRCGGPSRRRAVQDCDRSGPIGTLGFILSAMGNHWRICVEP